MCEMFHRVYQLTYSIKPEEAIVATSFAEEGFYSAGKRYQILKFLTSIPYA